MKKLLLSAVLLAALSIPAFAWDEALSNMFTELYMIGIYSQAVMMHCPQKSDFDAAIRRAYSVSDALRMTQAGYPAQSNARLNNGGQSFKARARTIGLKKACEQAWTAAITH
jgi:hypothetical protein